MSLLPIIAVVDDDTVYRRTVQKLLQSTELIENVLAFENGYFVLDYLQNQKDAEQLPDIILLDINMPQMDGWAFLDAYDKLKPELSKDIRIYMVSSSSSKEDINKAKTYNSVASYISKPFSKKDLFQVLNLH
ncbi:MAG TPA: response regulator [Chitinophagaceae bacterium]|nr:response regulator [Chitinophagaceae bacterium]